ncbi:hypothetical protein [Paenibacillus peoriae]|uniref:hypothetical protein n=1 Tax=Paenibacillus peoriae TaxID=59893 RepID=UPI00215B5E08|nr:hypothetical protein [Paenibacillus peoriae]
MERYWFYRTLIKGINENLDIDIADVDSLVSKVFENALPEVATELLVFQLELQIL